MRRPIDSVYVNETEQSDADFMICRLPMEPDLCARIADLAVPAISFAKTDDISASGDQEWDVTHLMYHGLVRLGAMNPIMARSFERPNDANLDVELSRERILKAGTFEVVCQSFLAPMAKYCRYRMLGSEAENIQPHEWSLARLQLLALRICIASSDELWTPEYQWPRELLPTRTER
jgi:hypothetical protein